MLLRTRAPAKINLTLHVQRRRLDGFHDLESLVAFAGVADILELAPGRPLALTVDGPTAAQAGVLADNLVLRATAKLAALVPGLVTGAFRLTKRLPVGAGIGGGSSDAAAALRLLARLNDLSLSDQRLHEAARQTGSDVPVCLVPRTRMMRGTGDELARHHAPARPVYAVLVNPGVHLDTRLVFGAMGLGMGQEVALEPHPIIDDRLDHQTFFQKLRAGRNDMQAAACGLAPAIDGVLRTLNQIDDAGLVRMSGSGSTCFALFGDRGSARRAAGAIGREPRGWWIRTTVLM